MAQLLHVAEDGTVIMDKIALKYTSGNIIHSGSIAITNSVQIDNNLVVAGTITANTFNVKNLVTENGSLDSVGQWIYNTEAELNGKGFTWSYGGGQTQLAYRTGNRIWTSGSFDVAGGSSYNIDNIPVLTLHSLGGTVTTSNLTQVGTLESLSVSGDATFADFIYVNSTSNRIGIGTDDPNTPFSILDNNVEIGISSPEVNLGAIGTVSGHDLAITTDNTPRITVKSFGEVQVGNPQSNAAVLRVYGTIYANKIQTISDNGLTKSVDFVATDTTSIYGLGVKWSSNGTDRQLVMMADPDRLWTTENFDLAPNRSYHINGQSVLGATSLGTSVVNSNLRTVGTLTSLTVGGDTTLRSVSASSLTLGELVYDASGIHSAGQLVVSADANQITIGNINVQDKPVKVFGPLSINVNNPEPGVQFTVNGDVKISGKKFTTGVTAPGAGIWAQGDICWNAHPSLGGHVGWICVAGGTPGAWAGFGLIANQ
jgi:hypothetical protein